MVEYRINNDGKHWNLECRWPTVTLVTRDAQDLPPDTWYIVMHCAVGNSHSAALPHQLNVTGIFTGENDIYCRDLPALRQNMHCRLQEELDAVRHRWRVKIGNDYAAADWQPELV